MGKLHPKDLSSCKSWIIAPIVTDKASFYPESRGESSELRKCFCNVLISQKQVYIFLLFLTYFLFLLIKSYSRESFFLTRILHLWALLFLILIFLSFFFFLFFLRILKFSTSRYECLICKMSNTWMGFLTILSYF